MELTLSPCLSGINRADVERLVAVELGADLVNASGLRQDVTRAEVECAANVVVIRVHDPGTFQSYERGLELSATAPRARERLLALAVVELIATSWSESEPAPAPAKKAEQRAPQPLPIAPPLVQEYPNVRTPEPSRRLVVHQSAELWLEERQPLQGLGVRFIGDGPVFGWHAALRVGMGQIPFGEYEAELQNGAFSLGVHLAQRLPHVMLRAGLGAQANVLRLRVNGDSRRGEARADALLYTGVSWLLPRDLVFDLGVDAGYALTPLTLEIASDQELELSGAWLGATLGLGLSL